MTTLLYKIGNTKRFHILEYPNLPKPVFEIFDAEKDELVLQTTRLELVQALVHRIAMNDHQIAA